MSSKATKSATTVLMPSGKEPSISAMIFNEGQA